MIRWPWVSRRALDLALDSVNRERLRAEAMDARHETQLAQAAQREAHLLNRLLELEREGFRSPLSPSAVELPDSLPANVQQAIQERAFTAEVRRQLEAFAYQQLREGEEPTRVALRILAGAEMAVEDV